MKKYIYICGVKYKITYKAKDADIELVNNYGYITYSNKEIVICKDYRKATQASTLRHEIIHALFFESGLCEYTNDETLVTFLELQLPKLLQIFKDCNVECILQLRKSITQRKNH